MKLLLQNLRRTRQNQTDSFLSLERVVELALICGCIILDHHDGVHRKVFCSMTWASQTRKSTPQMSQRFRGMPDEALKCEEASPPGELLRCIRSVASGEAWLEQNHLNALLHELSRPHHEESEQALTDREKAVLRSLLQGLSNKQIAERMQVRETAVKFIIQTLFRKTGVHARSQLVRVALEKYREELGG